MLVDLDGCLIGQTVHFVGWDTEEHPHPTLLPTGDGQGVRKDFIEGTTTELFNLGDCFWPINVNKDQG